MAVSPKQAYGGQPGLVTAVLATVAANKRWFSVQIVLANTSASPASVTLGKNGSAVADQFLPDVVIPANTTETLDLGSALVFVAGDTIDGLQASSGAMTVFIGVIEEDV